jgi:putative PEP-CTERM system TPR-repeat lipoprotein
VIDVFAPAAAPDSAEFQGGTRIAHRWALGVKMVRPKFVSMPGNSSLLKSMQHRLTVLSTAAFRRFFCALALGVGLASARADTVGRYYEDALARYERKDYAGAEIQLKNALQKDIKLLSAHLLMGRVKLKQGDPQLAEESFQQAIKLGVSRAEIAELIAQAQFEQGKFLAVIEKTPLEGMGAATKARVLVWRAHAFLATNNYPSAQQSLDQAAALSPNDGMVPMARARMAQKRGNIRTAVQFAAEAVSKTTNDPQLWISKSSIDQAAGNFDAALTAYDRALALDSESVEARVSRASLLFAQGRETEASADLKILKEVQPSEPRAAYLRSQIAARRGDNKMVSDELTTITRVLDPIPLDRQRGHPQLLLLGGLAHYGLKEHAQAIGYLDTFLKVDPTHTGVRKLLGSLYLSENKPDLAAAVLEPGLRAPGADRDPYLFALLASAHTALKRYQKGAEYLQKAVSVGGAPGELNADYGMALIRAGNENGGIERLRQALAADPGQPRAGVALAMVHMQRNEAAQARAVMEQVARREGNPGVMNLLAVTRNASGDRMSARAAFERALQLAPTFTAARLNLARLEVDDGKPEAARKRLQQVMREQPADPQAMYEFARLEQRAGRVDAALNWLNKSLDSAPRNVPAGVLLVRLLIESGQAPRALERAKDLADSQNIALESFEVLGEAYLANDDPTNAKAVFARMISAAGFDPGWQLRLARWMAQLGDVDQAMYCVEKALTAKPGLLSASVLGTEIELANNRIAAAEQRLRQLNQQYPAEAVVLRLNGDLALAKRDTAAAITAYRSALAKDDNADNAVRAFTALSQANKLRDGLDFLADWVRRHPQQLATRRVLADAYLAAGDFKAARANYDGILAKTPKDADMLNNLANVLIKLGDYSAAAARAEAAYKLAPVDPAIADTLGWALVLRGDGEKGLRYLREARLRNPDSAELRYHLAVALEKIGRRDEARDEVQQALAGGSSFEGVEDAKRMLQRLRGS